MDLPIKISSKALVELKDVVQNKSIPEGYGLRIGMKGGGCSGTFFLGFDTQQEHDLEYQVEGLDVYLDKRQLMYLINVELDFVEESDQQGFVFRKEPVDQK